MNWIKKVTKTHLILVAVLLTTACLVVPHIAHAGIDTVLINISSWIAKQIIYVIGQLLLIAIHILIKIAGFNEFVDANAVNIGWVIIRDVANLAIVIALMIIAFATVLNKQSYHYKKLLPKLLLAAILVNFSKSIAGLLIDLGQVVMMTFVHAFENIAAGNITYGLGLQDLLSIRNVAERGGAEINDWNVFGALVLAVIMVTVALCVVVGMIVMLLWRIVALWLLIIFSPIAYVAGLIPGGQKYASEWWSNFGKYIVFGPVLAFLFWLSMSVLSQMTTESRVMNLQMESKEYLAGGRQSMQATDYAYFASQVSSPQRIFDYMVTIALLIACLMFAQKAGVMGANVAGDMMGKLGGAGKWIARRPKVWGGKAKDKAWQRAKDSYAGAGVRALAQRGKTSWAGRKVGLDKEYSEMQRMKKEGIMATKWGGERFANARRMAEAQVAIKKQEQLKQSGKLDDKNLAYDAFKEMASKNDKAGMQGVMREMTENKWLTPKIMNEYQEKFGYSKHGITSSQGRDAAILDQQMWKAQEKAGDVWAPYKVGTEYNEAKGKYETKSGDKVISELDGEIKGMSARDVSNRITTKNLGGKLDDKGVPVQKMELDFVESIQKHHEDNLGRIDPGKRKIAADSIKNMLANNEAWGIEKGSDRYKKLNKFHQLLTADKSNFHSTTGRFNGMDNQGNIDYDDPAIQAMLGAELEDKDLQEARAKMGGKAVATRRDQVEAGKEKLSDVEKKIGKKVMGSGRFLGVFKRGPAKKVIENVRRAKSIWQNEFNENSSANEVKSFVDNIEGRLSPITDEIAKKDRDGKRLDQINPQTRQRYAYGEAYAETGIDKAHQTIKDTLAPVAAGTAKLDDKKHKIVNDAMSYIESSTSNATRENRKTVVISNLNPLTAYSRTGKAAEEYRRGIREETRELADGISNLVSLLKTETDPIKIDKIVRKAYKRAKQANRINSPTANKDEYSRKRIKELKNELKSKKALARGRFGTKQITQQELDKYEKAAKNMKEA